MQQCICNMVRMSNSFPQKLSERELADFSHIADKQLDLHRFPLSHQIELKILLLTNRVVYNLVPPYSKELISQYKPPKCL